MGRPWPNQINATRGLAKGGHGLVHRRFIRLHGSSQDRPHFGLHGSAVTCRTDPKLVAHGVIHIANGKHSHAARLPWCSQRCQCCRYFVTAATVPDEDASHAGTPST